MALQQDGEPRLGLTAARRISGSAATWDGTPSRASSRTTSIRSGRRCACKPRGVFTAERGTTRHESDDDLVGMRTREAAPRHAGRRLSPTAAIAVPYPYAARADRNAASLRTYELVFASWRPISCSGTDWPILSALARDAEAERRR